MNIVCIIVIFVYLYVMKFYYYSDVNNDLKV